jgi:hypothetical protein
MQVASRIELLEQVFESDSHVRIGALRIDKELWNICEVNATRITIDELVEVAAENIIKHRTSGKVLLVTAEIPGLRVILGENALKNVSTIISPKPSYLRKLLFVKCKGSEKCIVVYEFKPRSQVLVYEGAIELLKNIDYDFIILECEDYKRVILRHELTLPVIKNNVKTGRRKRKKQRTKTRKSEKRE